VAVNHIVPQDVEFDASIPDYTFSKAALRE